MEDATIFVVSEDAAVRDSIAELASDRGLHAQTFASLDPWRNSVPPERRGCLVLDARAGDFAGAQPLARFAAICAERPVVVMVDRGDVPITVCALKGGAADVLEKPCRDPRLLDRVVRATVAWRPAGAEARSSADYVRTLGDGANRIDRLR